MFRLIVPSASGFLPEGAPSAMDLTAAAMDRLRRRSFLALAT
jgi:hypothetical protein